MSSYRRFVNYVFNGKTYILDKIITRYMYWLPDKLYISLRYRVRMGNWINWDNPVTFCEKINWLKIYNRKAEYTRMVDKLEVKKYVANIIGEDFIIPTIGIWHSPEEIDWDKLPEQFVLKTTHGGGNGGVVICTDKLTFDRESAIIKLRNSMSNDIYRSYREWPYKNVKKRIIAETYMTSNVPDSPIDLPDYKFFCFNGEPKYCQVIRDRNSKETIDFYDMEWKHQNFVGLNPVASNGLNPVTRPKKFEVMKDISRKLAKDIPFIRVDLYVIDDSIYFGELTFFPASGIGEFSPSEWSTKLGNLLTLPVENR